MKRSLCRVMIGVVGLAVLGMTATLAALRGYRYGEPTPLKSRI
jgi:hypothetical protein